MKFNKGDSLRTYSQDIEAVLQPPPSRSRVAMAHMTGISGLEL